MCVGMQLALMELTAVAEALAGQVAEIEVGAPEVAMNNTICAISRLPARLHAQAK